MPYIKKHTKKTTRYPRKQYRKKRIVSSKTFNKKVLKVINAQSEDKMAYKEFLNTNYNSAINIAGDLNFIIPNISNGTTDNARIGDQIRAKHLLLSGYFITNLTYTSYSQCRIGVRMMIVQPKSYQGYDAINSNATTWMPSLLKKGGTTTGFTGLVSDLYAPINTDLITHYYNKVFYVNTPYIPGTTTNDVSTYNSTKFFKIRMRLRNKLLKYDASNNSGLTPTSYNPVLVIGYSHLDSSIPDTVNTEINLNFISTLTYQDD